MTVALPSSDAWAAAPSSIMSDEPVTPGTTSASAAASERSLSPSGSSTSYATVGGSWTCMDDTDAGAVSGVADAAREEAKRRRAAEKRAKESLKKDAAKLKALSKKDEAARKQQEDVAARRADALAERRRLGDAIVVPSFVDARTPEAAARAEAKSEREAVRQQGWDAQEAGWTKDELRDYYKAGRSKPKGKTPVRESRQFGDL